MTNISWNTVLKSDLLFLPHSSSDLWTISKAFCTILHTVSSVSFEILALTTFSCPWEVFMALMGHVTGFL